MIVVIDTQTTPETTSEEFHCYATTTKTPQTATNTTQVPFEFQLWYKTPEKEDKESKAKRLKNKRRAMKKFNDSCVTPSTPPEIKLRHKTTELEDKESKSKRLNNKRRALLNYTIVLQHH